MQSKTKPEWMIIMIKFSKIENPHYVFRSFFEYKIVPAASYMPGKYVSRRTNIMKSDPVTRDCIKECILVPISKEEEDYCKNFDFDKTWHAHEKRGNYGKGLTNNAIFLGLIGECALSKILGHNLDWEPKKRGDAGYEFIIHGKKVDIKTASLGNSYQRNFIVHYDYNVSLDYELTSDIYVGSYIEEKNNRLSVILVGYINVDEIKDRKPIISPASNSNHTNIEIYHAELHPMREFLKLQENNKIVGTSQRN